MDKFKIVLGINNIEDEEILNTFNDISSYLIKYIDESKYDITVCTVDDNCTDVEKLEKVTSLVPDAFIYFNFTNNIKISNDAYVSMYELDKMSETQLEFGNNFISKLNEFVNGLDIFNKNVYDKTYMNRVRYYPSLTLNINSDKKDIFTKTNTKKALAKVIFLSLSASFNLPEKDVEIKYITTGNLNMKDVPNKSGTYITTIPKGTYVDVLEKYDVVYWKVRVEIDGTKYEGYCAQMYIIASN